MVLNVFKKRPLLWLYVAGALLILVAAWLWCFKASVDPERVFWATIERSLSTHGVTVESKDSANGTGSEQTIRYSLGADNLSHSLTTLTQGATTITNEMIGTPTVDYTRYVDIKTDQKKADGTDMDFSKLLGVWAKGPEGSNQLFSQAVFGASLPIGGVGVPVGNLSPDIRTELVNQIRDDNVYQVDFDKTKKENVDGRLQYTYSATIRTEAYVALMKKYIQSVGLHGLDQANPDDYKGQPPFKLDITVDARSHQVVRVTAPDTGSTQTYSNYDVPVQIELPEDAITGAELQKRLAELQ
jgi:hypothetical protein